MAERQIDPARLEGERLRRWYLRSPDEIERERQAAAEQRHASFFEGSQDGSQAVQRSKHEPMASDPDVVWAANGYGGYRAVRQGSSDFLTTLDPHSIGDRPDYLPESAAAPEAGEMVEVGNPHNPRLRKEWEVANGRAWPRTADGQPYDVAHIRAIADGGTNTLDNIRPMERAEHVASHKDDYSRFGKRASIARAFGGKVEPPAHAPRPKRGPTTVRGFGMLGQLPNILGLFNGRIRTDTPVHTWNDLLGLSSEDDQPDKDLIA